MESMSGPLFTLQCVQTQGAAKRMPLQCRDYTSWPICVCAGDTLYQGVIQAPRHPRLAIKPLQLLDKRLQL